jgi:hypothetical protein
MRRDFKITELEKKLNPRHKNLEPLTKPSKVSTTAIEIRIKQEYEGVVLELKNRLEKAKSREIQWKKMYHDTSECDGCKRL